MIIDKLIKILFNLNTSNLLLTREFNLEVVKIADLGISKYIESSTEGKTFGGTKQYMSPEQFRGQKYDSEDFEIHSFNTDVW